MNRVVITGIGIYSCIGKNIDEVADSLYMGGQALYWMRSGRSLDTVPG
jgi:3-oxoacyl-[acyl-carrier-protein] synthase-1